MNRVFTAIIQQDGPWWIGWVEEVHGVNAQAKTRKKLLENLQECLKEALAMNRELANQSLEGRFEKVELVA